MAAQDRRLSRLVVFRSKKVVDRPERSSYEGSVHDRVWLLVVFRQVK